MTVPVAQCALGGGGGGGGRLGMPGVGTHLAPPSTNYACSNQGNYGESRPQQAHHDPVEKRLYCSECRIVTRGA